MSVTTCSSQGVKSDRKEIVLVIGSSGFLGQHLVAQLADEDFVSEIRVFDKVPYKNKLGHVEKPGQIVSILGDIRRLDDLTAATRGVSVVIHSASLIDVSLFPDTEALESINVKGTQNVIESCILQNVSLLVYTSTADGVVGFDSILNGDETHEVPKKLLFPDYGTSKGRAESLILAANGRKLANNDNSVLQTVCLRPSTLYGEYDTTAVTVAIQTTKAMGGTLVRIGDGTSISPMEYVGNIAWAHICAVKAARTNREVGGHAYFVNDDTPPMNLFVFMGVFLEPCGCKVSKLYIPYWIAYILFAVVGIILSAARLFYPVNTKMTLSTIVYANRTFHFSRRRAELDLGYTPRYSWEDSRKRSTAYYQSFLKSI